MQQEIKVIFIPETGEKETFELYANNIADVISLLRLQKDEEFITNLLNTGYKFILADSKDSDNAIALMPEVVLSDFSGYDTLYIIADISGEIPLAAGAFLAGAMGATGMAASVAGFAITMVLNMALSMALQAIMNALAPTPEFSGDPASTQNTSNLFNGAPIVRDQGGSMPLIFGNPYCGAVLISSGAFTEEVTI